MSGSTGGKTLIPQGRSSAMTSGPIAGNDPRPGINARASQKSPLKGTQGVGFTRLFSRSPGIYARAGFRWLKDPYAVLDRARERHGLTFWLDLTLAGRAFVTGDPALVREITNHPDLDAGRGIAALKE